MAETRIFQPPESVSRQAYISSLDEYKEIYQKSVADPEGFWGKLAEQLHWYQKWDRVLEENFAAGEHQWFIGGKLNVSYNCLDRHVASARKNKAAIIWEGDIGDSRTLTYQQLYHEVNRAANMLKKHGVKKGDRVAIYLPMIPEAAVAMLACARIGAIHSVVFGGFASNELAQRIQHAAPKVILTASCGVEPDRVVAYKPLLDRAIDMVSNKPGHCVVRTAQLRLKHPPDWK